jgi:predicted glycosyltransferase involved in capsule biosynthesis
MKICVVIPWRSQKRRIPAQKIVLRFYRKVLQGYSFSIILSYSKGDFNVAKARNMGVARAIQESADVIIIGDADTIPEKNALLEGITKARTESECVLPFSEYRSLTNFSTLIYLYINKKFGAAIFKKIEGASGGIYICTPEVWLKCGGQDERFKGWGGEDTAFAHKYKSVFGKDLARINGKVIALQHGINRRQMSDANAKLHSDEYS